MKNLPSHENQDLEKKRTLYIVLIIIAALTFASTFFKVFQFFQDFFYFSTILALSGAITPPLQSARAA